MRPQMASSTEFPTTAGVETWQDLLMVSTFGLWAMLLGVTPVVAVRMLMG